MLIGTTLHKQMDSCLKTEDSGRFIDIERESVGERLFESQRAWAGQGRKEPHLRAFKIYPSKRAQHSRPP